MAWVWVREAEAVRESEVVGLALGVREPVGVPVVVGLGVAVGVALDAAWLKVSPPTRLPIWFRPGGYPAPASFRAPAKRSGQR